MLKNIRRYVLAFVFVFVLGFVYNSGIVRAEGEYATISGGGSVKEGDSVTVTVKVTNNDGLYGVEGVLKYDSSVIEYSSANGATVHGGGGQIKFVQDYDGTNSASISVTFRTVGTGSTNVTLAACDVIGGSSMDIKNCAGGNAAVTVNPPQNNPAPEQPSGNAGSSDSSLKSLVISPGKLSPSFNAGTLYYTTKLDEDVTEMTVSAAVNHSGAKVLSVNGSKSLKPGKNVVSVVVQAENGTKSTYYITVYCGDSADEQDLSEVDINIGEAQYTIENIIPDELIASEYEETSMKYEEKNIKILKNKDNGVVLVYLRNKEDESAALYVYDEEAKKFYPYVKVKISGDNYIILKVLGDGEEIPKNYALTTVKMGDRDFEGYQKIDNFVLVKAVDKAGEEKWYQYDTIEGTIQRYVDDSADLQEQNKLIKEELEKTKASIYDTSRQQHLIICVLGGALAVMVVVLIVVIVVMARKNKKCKESAMLDEDDMKETTEEVKESLPEAVEEEQKETLNETVEESKEIVSEEVSKDTEEDVAEELPQESLEQAEEKPEEKSEEFDFENMEIVYDDSDEDFEIFSVDDL